MNTLIHLWVDPLIIRHKKGTDKLYFNVIIHGNHMGKEPEQLDKVIEGKILWDIMDMADIESNYNYACLWAKLTNKPVSITQVNSPQQNEDIKKEKAEKKESSKRNRQIIKLVNSKKDIPLTEKNVIINDEDPSKINILLPVLKVSDTIDFSKIWAIAEKAFLGKMKKGDEFTILDDNGNKILEVLGGNFINAGLADLQVKGKDGNIKGGAFIRKDGSIDIGDIERTFYLKIYTNSLLKSSLRLGKSVMELTQQKLLK